MIELLQTRFEKLTKTEAESLRKILRAKHGNVKACAELTDLTPFTLRRAAERMELLPENVKIIRDKLLSEQLENA